MKLSKLRCSFIYKKAADVEAIRKVLVENGGEDIKYSKIETKKVLTI